MVENKHGIDGLGKIKLYGSILSQRLVGFTDSDLAMEWSACRFEFFE